MLSVIIPAYNEENSVFDAYKCISDTLDKTDTQYEIIFVDDGSLDGTWGKIKALNQSKGNVCGIHFSRNFGKDAAIYAGLEKSQGDCCVVIDCDLQHPPDKIADMYALWEQGYEIIEGVKSNRGKEGKLKKLAAKEFYSIIGSALGTDMANASDFKLLDKKVVDVLVDMPERSAFFRALSSWVGFKKTTIEFEVSRRKNGQSKWSLGYLVKYALANISSFSSAPMYFVAVAGSLMFVSAVFALIYALVYSMAYLAMTSILLFLGSVILISLGIMGYYLSRMYDEIKGRPRYIISGVCEKKDSKL